MLARRLAERLELAELHVFWPQPPAVRPRERERVGVVQALAVVGAWCDVLLGGRRTRREPPANP